jgi:DNA-binding MarR family transcriptional regulator
MMQLHQLGDNVSMSLQVQGIELPPLMRTLTQLEKQGYLLRTTSPYDKRIRLLTLTPEGKAILKRLTQIDVSGARIAKHRAGTSRHFQRHVESNRLQFADNPRRR